MVVELTNHTVSSESDMLMGEDKYLPWSFSRMDVAGSCLYKFNKIYQEGIREFSPALTLGGLSHEIIAELLKDGVPSLEKANLFLATTYPMYSEQDTDNAAKVEVQKLLPYMVDFVNTWKAFLASKGIKKDRVEIPYAITRDHKRASFVSNCVNSPYLRGIIDLWAWDSKTKTIYIIDHKTNKSSQSSNKVKEHKQLNIYIWMLAKIYKLDWKKAVVGLNFLRRGKVVWATIYPHEHTEFVDKFFNTLKYLEFKLYECENEMIWPAVKSFKCSWCSFKDTCQTYNAEV